MSPWLRWHKHTDELNTKKIFSSGDTFGDRECDQALVGDESVYSPFCSRSVAIFVYLKPVEASHVSLKGRWNLGTILK